MKGDTLQRNDAGFPCGAGSPYYMEKLNYSALIKQIFLKNCKSIGFHVPKTSFRPWNNFSRTVGQNVWRYIAYRRSWTIPIFVLFLTSKDFSRGFTRTITWHRKGYDYLVFSFYWLFVNATFGDWIIARNIQL